MEPKSAPATPYIINTGNNGSATKYLVIAAVAGGALYFGKQAWETYQKNKGEANLATPEGQIALQLKAVFDAAFPSAAEFRRIYVQVNSGNKVAVATEYKRQTGRYLSDDIARLPSDVVSKAAKVEEINNKADGVIKISADEAIQFMVAKGSQVVFTNPSKAVDLYATPKGMLWFMSAEGSKPVVPALEKIKASVIGRTDVMTVDGTTLLSYSGAKLATDWTKLFRPFVKTRKVYAIVRIKIKAKDGTYKYLWVDARELSKYSGKPLKGLGIIDLAG